MANPWAQMHQQTTMPKQQLEMASASQYPGLSDALTSRIPFDSRGNLQKPKMPNQQSHPFAKGQPQQQQQRPQMGQSPWGQMQAPQQQQMGPSPYTQMPMMGQTGRSNPWPMT